MSSFISSSRATLTFDSCHLRSRETKIGLPSLLRCESLYPGASWLVLETPLNSALADGSLPTPIRQLVPFLPGFRSDPPHRFPLTIPQPKVLDDVNIFGDQRRLASTAVWSKKGNLILKVSYHANSASRTNIRGETEFALLIPCFSVAHLFFRDVNRPFSSPPEHLGFNNGTTTPV
jgi:hypothetical protein